MDQILNHSDAAVSRLLEQYRDKSNLVSLVRAYADRIQALETSLFELYTLRWVDTATGAALDNLGEIVGVARGPANDATYRLYVKSRIRLLRSSGTAEDLLETLDLVVPVGVSIHLQELPPAGFRIDLEGAPVTASDAVVFAAIMRQTRSAGVGGALLWYETANREFQLDTGTVYDTWDLNAGAHVQGDIVIGNGCVFRLNSVATGPGPAEPDWSLAPNVGDTTEEDPGGGFGGPWEWENIKPAASGDGYDHGLGFADPVQDIDSTYGGRLWGVSG